MSAWTMALLALRIAAVALYAAGLYWKASPTNQPEDHMSNIAAAVTKARTTAGLTQIEVALAASIGQSYLSQIEGGKRTPTTEVLKRLARALGVKVSDLDSELA